MTGIFIALLSGALMSIQGVFNTEVTKASSVWVSASWVQFSALVTCLAVWSIKERTNLLGVFQVSPELLTGRNNSRHMKPTCNAANSLTGLRHLSTI